MCAVKDLSGSTNRRCRGLGALPIGRDIRELLGFLTGTILSAHPSIKIHTPGAGRSCPTYPHPFIIILTRCASGHCSAHPSIKILIWRAGGRCRVRTLLALSLKHMFFQTVNATLCVIVLYQTVLYTTQRLPCRVYPEGHNGCLVCGRTHSTPLNLKPGGHSRGPVAMQTAPSWRVPGGH